MLKTLQYGILDPLAVWNTGVSVAVLFLIPQFTTLHVDPYKSMKE